MATFLTNDPLNNALTSYIIKTTGYDVLVLLATERMLTELSGIYGDGREDDFVSFHVEDNLEKLKEMAFEAPVIKFLNTLVSRAVDHRATDIHIEPYDVKYKIKFRIDGILHDMEFLDESFTWLRYRG